MSDVASDFSDMSALPTERSDASVASVRSEDVEEARSPTAGRKVPCLQSLPDAGNFGFLACCAGKIA